MALRDYFNKDLLWEEIKSNPIERRDILKLKNLGWKIIFDNRYAGYIGVCDFDEKEIWVLPDLSHWITDKTICHEIAHAVYGKDLSIDMLLPELEKAAFNFRKKNKILIEWTSRRIRATPTLLNEIWKAFDIPPRIYDRASLLATQELIKPQLLFPSFFEDYCFTLMD